MVFTLSKMFCLYLIKKQDFEPVLQQPGEPGTLKQLFRGDKASSILDMQIRERTSSKQPQGYHFYSKR